MGQTLCKDPVDTRPQHNGLSVWGDYVNADTRTILAIMELCEEKYVFRQLDTLTNKHLEDQEFLKVNPTLDIPVITENNYTIISGPMQYVNYLIQTRENVKRMLYSSESKVEIDRNIQHFTGKMRPVTSKIIRMLTTRLVEDFKTVNKAKMTTVPKEIQERTTLSSSRTSQQVPERATIQKEIETHLTKLLEHLNQHLSSNLYFGDAKRISVDDLMYFNEIQTIQTLYESPVLVEGSQLKQWYQRVEKEPELTKLKQQFDRSLNVFKGQSQ